MLLTIWIDTGGKRHLYGGGFIGLKYRQPSWFLSPMQLFFFSDRKRRYASLFAVLQEVPPAKKQRSWSHCGESFEARGWRREWDPIPHCFDLILFFVAVSRGLTHDRILISFIWFQFIYSLKEKVWNQCAHGLTNGCMKPGFRPPPMFWSIWVCPLACAKRKGCETSSGSLGAPRYLPWTKRLPLCC